MANFEEIDKARRLLGLGEEATLKEIKQAYRRMAFRYHPDSAGKDVEVEETMKQLNRAYKLLLDYCATYSYSFTREEIAKTYYYEEHLRKFYHDWFNEAQS